MRVRQSSLPPGANIFVGREGRRALLATVLVVTVLGLGLYAGSRSLTWSDATGPQASPATTPNDDQIYTGSIVFVPFGGDSCWRRFLDNRTGRVWDQGIVSCDIPEALGSAARYSPTERAETISKGFRKHLPAQLH